MSEIPDDIFGAAHFALMGHAIGVDLGEDRKTAIVNDVARAIFMEREACNGWKPIDTAPKDGSFVDLWHKSGTRYANCRWFTNSLGYTCWHIQPGGRAYNAGPDTEYTHWMPLPSPPQRE